MRRAAAVGVLLGFLCLLGSGCRRDVEPPPLDDGEPCTSRADCNPGLDCGALRACLFDPEDPSNEGFCEAGRSVVVPCPGEGSPVGP